MSTHRRNSQPHEAGGASAQESPAESGRPDSADTRQQLERILGSAEFVGSDRTRRFLRYVVEETLAGRGSRIKAFSIAIATFDRDESFDPQADPIVRIEAGRVRRSLERYYLVAGTADPIRIEIPRGTYVPVFTWSGDRQGGEQAERRGGNAAPPESATSPTRPRLAPRSLWLVAAAFLVFAIALAAILVGRDAPPGDPATAQRPDLPHPSVAVLPFGISSSEPQYGSRLSVGVTNEVIRELSRYSSLFVVGPQSLQRFGETPDVARIGAEIGTDFALSGDILLAAGRLQVAVRLIETRTGGIVWAETYDRDFSIDRMFDLEVEIARDIVRRIGQPQGAIALFDWKRTRGMAPETWEAYDCVVQADSLHRQIRPPAQASEILACLERTVEQEPGYADGWIMLALFEIDGFRFAPLSQLAPDTLEQAADAASRAVDLAPNSGRAHLALMMALYFQGQVEAALAEGQIAIRFAPQDPDILAEVGLRNVLSGDLNAGMGLIEQAVNLSPTLPSGYALAQALGYLRMGLYQKASDAIVELRPNANFVHWAIAAAVHGKAGRHDHARQAVEELLTLYPDFASWAWLELERRSIAPELASALVSGWREAGLDIPASPDAGSGLETFQ